MTDGVVLVKQGRPRAHTGRWMPDGGWVASVQERAERDALEEWGQRPVEPFKVVPPLPDSKWEPVSLHILAKGMYKQVKSILP